MSDIAKELWRLSSDMGGTPRYAREYFEKGAIEIERLESALAEKAKELERVREALIYVRSIIVEGAATGFNYKDGDWAERLYLSQGRTHAALKQEAAANG